MTKGYTCPKCRRVQHFCCSNKGCQCWRRLRKGQKAMRWKRDRERLACPYCGFTAHADYWFDREIQTVKRNESATSVGAVDPHAEASNA